MAIDRLDSLQEFALRCLPPDEFLQQDGTVIGGQVLQVQLDDRSRALVPETVQVGKRYPGGDQAETVPARFGQVREQRPYRFVSKLAAYVRGIERVLERFDAVEHEQELLFPDEGRELMAPLAGVDADRGVVAEPG